MPRTARDPQPLGLPMSPFLLLQLVGRPVALHVTETLHAAFPDRFVVSPKAPVPRPGDLQRHSRRSPAQLPAIQPDAKTLVRITRADQG